MQLQHENHTTHLRYTRATTSDAIRFLPTPRIPLTTTLVHDATYQFIRTRESASQCPYHLCGPTREPRPASSNNITTFPTPPGLATRLRVPPGTRKNNVRVGPHCVLLQCHLCRLRSCCQDASTSHHKYRLHSWLVSWLVSPCVPIDSAPPTNSFYINGHYAVSISTLSHLPSVFKIRLTPIRLDIGNSYARFHHPNLRKISSNVARAAPVISRDVKGVK
jgi:hypothetical protein